MCLLIAISRIRADAPLIVAGNRDELYQRPAAAMIVLRARDPRILGGRDLLAGGTWLAVNQHGVVAGLTNRPAPGARDPAKRSRGELPLALAGHRDAASAVDDFARRFHPADFGPAWILVGDRSSLFHIDLVGDAAAVVRPLPPGVHILENRPLGAPSPKVDLVRAQLGPALAAAGDDELVAALAAVLSSHDLPPDVAAVGPSTPEPETPRPRATEATCVHAGIYGTRWSGIVRVPAQSGARPRFAYSDGPPCTAPYRDADPLWSD